MNVGQLPVQVLEFARYLNGLVGRLDRGGGWYGVFWHRDPEGMRACLEGREVPPWDVVEALLQDVLARYGERAAAQESARARALYEASLAAYDVRPGGRDALGDRLDVMLRERRYAAERRAELDGRIASAASREEADAIGVDLAWAEDDHERAIARCAELRHRMDNVDRHALHARAQGAPGFPPMATGVGAWTRQPENWADASGEHPAGHHPSGGSGPGRDLSPDASGWGDAQRDAAGLPGREGAPRDTAGLPGRGGALRGAEDASGGEGVPRGAGEMPGRAGAPVGAEGGFGGAGAPRATESGFGGEGGLRGRETGAPGTSSGARTDTQAGVHGAEAGTGSAGSAPGRVPRYGGTRHGTGTDTGPGGGSPATAAERVRTAAPLAADTEPAGPRPPSTDRVPGGHDHPRPTGLAPDGAAPSMSRTAPHAPTRDRRPESLPTDTPGADPLSADPRSSGAWHQGPAAAPAPAYDGTPPEVQPSPARRSKRRRRGGARFAGMVEADVAPAAVPQPAPVLPAAPAPGGRTPRGARFAGAAEEPVHPRVTAAPEPPDEDARRATAGTVAALTRLRSEGRSGEAHALLVEAAYWPPARFPLLAAELHRAGLDADWATLLWEAASLPAGRLVAAADALTAAGRTDDGHQMLRQGAVRPAPEIGAAVLGLADEGRGREIGALLDAYVRVRTPEEAARSVDADPELLVPLLLRAARGVSEECQWDLVHALRVAGFTT
ncbi:hypothetical protein [Streptomyces sp. NPDC018036]|uniref:hypothetical protein n=1 Tax=Streptomyces sp. NPDC018036 TaxID=3365035 RepID=UPI0037ADB903